MKFEQRAPVKASSFRPGAKLWRPEVLVHRHGADAPEFLAPGPDDRYAAIDDLASGIVVLRVSIWPKVDGSGRVVFPGRRGFPLTIHTASDQFHLRVSAERARHSQLAVDRQLRVGDVFLIRGMAKAEIPETAELWDVSAAARDIAKAAYYGAGAATVDEEYMERMGTVGDQPAIDSAPAGTFDVRQMAAPRGVGGLTK